MPEYRLRTPPARSASRKWSHITVPEAPTGAAPERRNAGSDVDDVAGAAQRGSRRVAANDGVNPGAAPVATGVCAETRACSRSSG